MEFDGAAVVVFFARRLPDHSRDLLLGRRLQAGRRLGDGGRRQSGADQPPEVGVTFLVTLEQKGLHRQQTAVKQIGPAAGERAVELHVEDLLEGVAAAHHREGLAEHVVLPDLRNLPQSVTEGPGRLAVVVSRAVGFVSPDDDPRRPDEGATDGSGEKLRLQIFGVGQSRPKEPVSELGRGEHRAGHQESRHPDDLGKRRRRTGQQHVSDRRQNRAEEASRRGKGGGGGERSQGGCCTFAGAPKALDVAPSSQTGGEPFFRKLGCSHEGRRWTEPLMRTGCESIGAFETRGSCAQR
mmetsp:Transcript_4595/g.11815  ORF Transcript_4595/g.11815 Transcript_4595/m.11815 type:complete len:296 (+) Transcript_4595:1928-2815(+)